MSSKRGNICLPHDTIVFKLIYSKLLPLLSRRMADPLMLHSCARGAVREALDFIGYRKEEVEIDIKYRSLGRRQEGSTTLLATNIKSGLRRENGSCIGPLEGGPLRDPNPKKTSLRFVTFD